MTDVTTQSDGLAGLSAADEQLLRELTERARAGGLKLTGEDGLLGKLTKMVVEGALEGEMDDHLGYEKHDPVGHHRGNTRNQFLEQSVLPDDIFGFFVVSQQLIDQLLVDGHGIFILLFT